MTSARDLRRLDDEALAVTAARLVRRLEQLDDATWYSAAAQRAECLARLDQARAEQARRAAI